MADGSIGIYGDEKFFLVTHWLPYKTFQEKTLTLCWEDFSLPVHCFKGFLAHVSSAASIETVEAESQLAALHPGEK